MMDLRLPIGWFFLINSALLIGVGCFDAHPVPFQGQNINLDLIWGVVMAAFGLFMAGLGYADKMKKDKPTPPAPEPTNI
jgi:hypothetical protein